MNPATSLTIQTCECKKIVKRKAWKGWNNSHHIQVYTNLPHPLNSVILAILPTNLHDKANAGVKMHFN